MQRKWMEGKKDKNIKYKEDRWKERKMKQNCKENIRKERKMKQNCKEKRRKERKKCDTNKVAVLS